MTPSNVTNTEQTVRGDILPRLKSCLLPTSSLSPKQTFQTLSNPIYSRKIEVRSDSGGDIDSGGLLNVVSEISKIVP